MKKQDSKEASELQKVGKWVDRLISIGFMSGVFLIVVLFLYVLFTQFLGKPQ